MMSMGMDCSICRIILIVTLTKLCIGSNPKIDSDYYYGNMVVRAGRVVIECDNRNKQYCLLKCGNVDYKCINNNCVCVKTYSSSRSTLEMHVSKKKSVEKYKAANIDRWPEEPLEQPILRHHIAHFCPDLDIARHCIRKCMAQGKPAFCGKDHVCYCSHRQKHNNNDLVNATDVYTQFKDMYIKYFGPGIFQEKPTEKPKKKQEGKKKKQIEKKDEEDGDEEEKGKDGEESKEDESKEKEGDGDGEEGKGSDEGAKDGEDAKEGEEGKEDEEDKEGKEDDAKENEDAKEDDAKEDEEKEKEEKEEDKEGRRRIFVIQY